jgi:hypothetical protein
VPPAADRGDRIGDQRTRDPQKQIGWQLSQRVRDGQAGVDVGLGDQIGDRFVEVALRRLLGPHPDDERGAADQRRGILAEHGAYRRSLVPGRHELPQDRGAHGGLAMLEQAAADLVHILARGVLQ